MVHRKLIIFFDKSVIWCSANLRTVIGKRFLSIFVSPFSINDPGESLPGYLHPKVENYPFKSEINVYLTIETGSPNWTKISHPNEHVRVFDVYWGLGILNIWVSSSICLTWILFFSKYFWISVSKLSILQHLSFFFAMFLPILIPNYYGNITYTIYKDCSMFCCDVAQNH